MRTFFDTTQSQVSKSKVYTREFCAAPLDNALYLSSLWSDLSRSDKLKTNKTKVDDHVIAEATAGFTSSEASISNEAL